MQRIHPWLGSAVFEHDMSWLFLYHWKYTEFKTPQCQYAPVFHSATTVQSLGSVVSLFDLKKIIKYL